MSNIVKNSSRGSTQPFIHVPKVDKITGEPIPEWKQQVMMAKKAKKLEKEQVTQNQVICWL